MAEPFKQKKALVTGAGKGIGREIAYSFAQRGFEVMVADINDEAGKVCVDSITALGAKGIFCHADISLPADISRLFEVLSLEMGGLDILVNNAGFGIPSPPEKLSIEEWDSVINTNLRGTFLCSREAATIMKLNNAGSIINIASTRAFMSEPDSEAYAASKGGIVALTHSMAASLAKFNIRVNCISPGWIETGDYSALREIDHSQHFSGRVGLPSDIAKACIFLAENDFINATNIIIDGGMTRKMIYEP